MIRYCLTTTDLGVALLAQSEYGLRAVGFSSSAAELRTWLRRLAVGENCEERPSALRDLAQAVRNCLQQPQWPCDLPMDIRGTEFQCRVWQRIASIPVGETWTYRRLAEQVGQPHAIRAAAAACGANPIAVLIPCHRVIGADGSLRGYRWGLERKRWLLAREGASIAAE